MKTGAMIDHNVLRGEKPAIAHTLSLHSRIISGLTANRPHFTLILYIRLCRAMHADNK